ncbi:hypothetical protein WSM22_06790 [Cytophagales bacterium WSM2-2]|nr:hypothetical protein WSM22_06790 [Cytophagales bacterium WSM2-2]
MFGLLFSEPAYRYWFVRQPHDYSKETKRLDSLMTTWKWKKDSSIKEPVRPIEISPELFSFNPNISPKTDLERLGFSRTLASRIVNYRSKGGKFIVKRDLLKVYGMDSVLFMKLNAYINLPERVVTEKPIRLTEKKEKPAITKFDLNTADTSQLMKIYGVGPKLSVRIIAYREKLGGFISMSQLKEVYGLDSLVIKELVAKSIVEGNFLPNQVNINTATEKELGAHPYIKFKLAKAIIAYRKQHGAFSEVDDLKKITIISEEAFLKIKPYATLQ